ncbi:EstA family serine hydrolase [soil metagenome]
MDLVHGHLDDRFASLGEAFASRLSDGTELGASLCVIKDGETVVDLWGGWSDKDKTVPWGEHTIATVWSTTKTMTNLTALVLVDRGEIDLDAPVAHYWPEFAQGGKEAVEVRHLLGHTSGIAGWDQPVTVSDLYEWEKSTAMLAAQAPWWPPGSASGYHLLNQGHLVGEVIRRVTGLSVGAFFAKEIAGPMDADFHIGLDAADAERVTPMVMPRALPLDPLDPDSIAYRALTGPFLHARETWTDAWRTAEVPAANGHGNARSIARAQAAVSHGGAFNGVQLLSERTLDSIFEVQAEGIDLVLGVPLRFGIGYALPEDSFTHIPAGRRCFWGGYGGSLILNDLDNSMTVAYVMNKMALEYAPGTRRTRPCGDSRTDAYLDAIYAALS